MPYLGGAAADRARPAAAPPSPSGRSCCPPSSSRSPASSSCCRSIGSPPSSSSTCPTRSATPAARTRCLPARDPRGHAGGRRRRHRRVRQGRARRAPAGGARREIDRLASTPVSSATDIGAALRLASALFPDDAQKRIVLLSDGNDTTGAGQSEAALAAARGIQIETRADRAGRRRRGPRRAADDAVDGAPRRDDRGRRRDPLDASPSRRRSGSSPTATLVATQPVELEAGANRVTFRRQADRGRLPHVPGRRRGRRATRSARTTGPTRTRSSRASRGRWSWPATTRSPRSSSTALKTQRQQVDSIVPEALPTDFAEPRRLRQHRPRRRARGSG